jgi:hypothetical protein
MDISPFIQFTLSTRYIKRWIYGGLMIYIPVLNFLSLGYLSKTSQLLIVGGMGLPTWAEKQNIWVEGLKLLFIFILYEAVPFFLFSCGFFLTTLSTITAFFGTIIVNVSYVALVLFSFFLPFAFASFSEHGDFRKALEYDRILQGIKEVLVPYAVGYAGTLVALFICKIFLRIPFLIGFLLSSLLIYYVFLIATYYFTELYKKTSLSAERVFERQHTGQD